MICLTEPCSAIKQHRPLMKASVDKSSIISTWTAKACKEQTTSFLLFSSLLSQERATTIHPVVCEWGRGFHLFFWEITYLFYIFNLFSSSLSSAFCCSLTVEWPFDLSFRSLCLRWAKALTAFDQDENFTRWSDRLTSAVDFVNNVWTILTSGSSIGRARITFVGGHISFSHRNLGPVSLLHDSNLSTVVPLDAWSAGFSLVGTYNYCWGVVLLRIFCTLFVTNGWKHLTSSCMCPRVTFETIQKNS